MAEPETDSIELTGRADDRPAGAMAGAQRRHAGHKLEQQVEDIELSLLLEAVYLRTGNDFRGYARPSLRRRVNAMVQAEEIATLSALQERALREPACMRRLLSALSVNVTTLFRDPEFFLGFRQYAVPLLKTYPFVRIWHAGCATGEEVYSMAVLLHEEGLYSRCRLYATDMDESALKRAREGILDLRLAQQYAAAYEAAGGTARLEDYYTAGYGHGIFRSFLKENVIFSQHNLAVDRSFNEFHAILCRNVMIYFAKPLQRHVHDLLHDSLISLGILGLGARESMQFTPHEGCYEPLAGNLRMYRKMW